MVSLESNYSVKKNKSCEIKVNNTQARGGWSTLPFIIGSLMGMSLAAGSWYANLTMFLMSEYNIEQSLATRVYGVLNIGVNIFPIVGAVLADSLAGSFLVISVALFASLSGLVMLCLSTIVPALKPHQCNNNGNNFLIDATCETPSTHQYVFLLFALALATIGFGCTRFMLSSLGAYQFHKPVHRRVFFNVYVLTFEICVTISYGVIVFILQSQERWSIGFGIGIATNTSAIILFVIGSQYYRHIIPKRNPLVSVVHALVSAIIKKIKASLTKDNRIFDDQQIRNLEMVHPTLPNTSSIRFRNKENTDGEFTNSLNGCLKEFEDLKKLIKIIPVWSTGILLNTVVVTISTLVIQQASYMDLTIGPRIKPPAAIMTVFGLVTTAISLSIFDWCLYPMWEKIIGRPIKPLQRGGLGHAFTVLGVMALSLVEIARLKSLKTNHLMSAYWLFLPMGLLGHATSHILAGSLTFHYQEFPKSLKSCSTAVPSIQVAIGFWLSETFIKTMKRESSWLPNDINVGRLDLVYWVLALVVAINFGYFLICSILYKYNVEDDYDSEPITSHSV